MGHLSTPSLAPRATSPVQRRSRNPSATWSTTSHTQTHITTNTRAQMRARTSTHIRTRTRIRTHSHTCTHTAQAHDPSLDAMPSEPAGARACATLADMPRPPALHTAPDSAPSYPTRQRRRPALSAGSVARPSSLSWQSPPPSCSHRLSRAHVQRPPHLPRAVSLLLGKALPAPASAADRAVAAANTAATGTVSQRNLLLSHGKAEIHQNLMRSFRCSCLVLVYGLAISSWPESPGLLLYLRTRVKVEMGLNSSAKGHPHVV
jgi:hypothetical protein